MALQSSSTKDFFETWSFLAQQDLLYLTVEDDQLPYKNESPNYGAIIANSLAEVGGKTTGFIYTDENAIEEGVSYISATPELVLRACFFIPELEIVAFDYSKGKSSSQQKESTDYQILDKINLARAIGGIALGEFELLEGVAHAESAETYLWQDKLFEAFYHSVASRLRGADVNDYFFSEIDCLFSFGFLPQVDQYLKWYKKSGKHFLFRTEYARWLSICGKAEAVTQWLEGPLEDPESDFLALYVRGLLRYKQHIFDEAIADFESCLEKFEFHYEARLGLGIALRNEGLKNNDPETLKRSASHLLTVAKAAGYHAPEALAHLGALMLSFRNWDKAETFLRKSLKLRENPVTRGFLEQSLASHK